MAITVKQCRAECTSLEDALTTMGAASADELAGLRPRRADDRAWLQYYGELRARHRVASGGGGAGSGSARPGSGLTSDRATALNLAAAPKPVRFVDGTTHYVHPKGAHALAWLDSLDRQLLDAYAAAAAVDAESPETGDALVLLPLLRSFAVQLWAWTLTHAGPELPFADDAHDLTPPAFTRTMAPEDVAALFLAHLEVHGERLRLTAELFPPDPTKPGTSRLTLSGFTGTQAADLGVRPSDLERRWSLGERFAMAVTAAAAAREAQERADAERRSTGSGA